MRAGRRSGARSEARQSSRVYIRSVNVAIIHLLHLGTDCSQIWTHVKKNEGNRKEENKTHHVPSQSDPRKTPPDNSETEVTCITIALSLAGEGFSQISECGLHHLVFRAAEVELLRVSRELIISPAIRLWGEGGALPAIRTNDARCRWAFASENDFFIISSVTTLRVSGKHNADRVVGRIRLDEVKVLASKSGFESQNFPCQIRT